MKKKIEFDSGKKVFPIIIAVIGAALMLAMWITRLNMTAVVCVAYCCIVSALIVIGMFFKRRLYLGFVVGYCAAIFGIITYYIAFGADAGFGAFTSGLAGFSSAEHPLLTGEVLRVIRSLADEHMTMVIVTHEMPFARAVSDRVVFLDGGVIVEQGSPEQVFENPQQERTKEFLQSYHETSSAQA